MTITVAQVVEALQERLQLRWLAGETGAHRPFGSNVDEPANLAGYLNLIHVSRIHVLGTLEMQFFHRIEPQRRKFIEEELMRARPPALIIAEGAEPPAEVLALCREQNVPLIATPVSSARVVDTLRVWLGKAVAPSVALHGVMMDVLGMGIIITGDSGLGKSELGLELISRGHGLVADDMCELFLIGPDTIEGRCPPLLRNMLEVRGLGLLDIKAIFGESAIRRKVKLKLIVHLIRRSTMETDYQRLPLQALSQEVMGVAVRKVVIPVASGRNLAVLTEAAVRNTILQLRGIDSTQEFIARQHRHIADDEGT